MLNEVAAVTRAFALLDLLSRAPAPIGISELARRSRLAKSTVHGLLRELEAAGAVERSGAGYRVGTGLERLGSVSELRRRWRPTLELLAAESGETAFLGQLRGSRVAIVDEVLGTGAPLVSAPVGSRVPAQAGALAKVLAGSRVALDEGEYLDGVNAAAASVPGGVIWVAGFAVRLGGERLAGLARLLEQVVA